MKRPSDQSGDPHDAQGAQAREVKASTTSTAARYGDLPEMWGSNAGTMGLVLLVWDISMGHQIHVDFKVCMIGY